MSYFGVLMFVVQLLGLTKAVLKLDILQNDNYGTEVPIFDTLQTIVGTNVILTCKLISSTPDNTSNYFDNEISWGWRRKTLQFQNITDLQKLANNSSRPLLQFLNRSVPNEATIAFNPLLHTDSGIYFCMSLKYRLFRILQINVIGKKNDTQIRSRRSNDKGSVLFPKFFCKNEMFICNSRTSCVNYEYVCDNIKDCSDGSDENEYVCGSNPCEGKAKCSSGRCLSQSFCCDYSTNASCTSDSSPPCCREIALAKKTTFIAKNTVIKDLVGFRDGGWVNSRDSERGEFHHPNDVKNTNAKVNKGRPKARFNETSGGSRRVARRKFLWILLSPVIVIVTVVGSLTKMWTDKCKNVPVNGDSARSSYGNDTNQEIYDYRTQSEAESNNVELDLPPSYDEATRIR